STLGCGLKARCDRLRQLYDPPGPTQRLKKLPAVFFHLSICETCGASAAACFAPHFGQNFVSGGSGVPHPEPPARANSAPAAIDCPHSGQKASFELTSVPHLHLMRSPPSCNPSASCSYSPARIFL